MRAFRLCIIFFLKLFPTELLFTLFLCTISSALLPATTTLLSLSIDICFKDFEYLLNLHRFWNIRLSFPNVSAILLDSVHKVQVLNTQSHVRLHQVTRFLESAFPITSLAEEIELCIYIFSRLLCSIVEYPTKFSGNPIPSEISKFSGIWYNLTLPDHSRYFRVFAHSYNYSIHCCPRLMGPIKQ